MTTVTAPATVTIALFAHSHADVARPGRVHAVAAWTDRGQRHYRRLATPVAVPDVWVRPVLRPACRRPRQLRLPLGDTAHQHAPSSAGATWATWTLPSVPTGLRHLPVDGAVGELARRLDRPDT